MSKADHLENVRTLSPGYMLQAAMMAARRAGATVGEINNALADNPFHGTAPRAASYWAFLEDTGDGEMRSVTVRLEGVGSNVYTRDRRRVV